jgi:hypothetical protein
MCQGSTGEILPKEQFPESELPQECFIHVEEYHAWKRIVERRSYLEGRKWKEYLCVG